MNEMIGSKSLEKGRNYLYKKGKILGEAKTPENWLEKSFNEVVKIVCGQVDPKEEPYSNMPHIGPGNVEAMTGKLLEYRTAKEDSQISGKYLFNEKHVLYGKINPQLGKVVMPGFAGVCSADMYAFEPNEEFLIPEYLKYLLFHSSFYRYTVSVSKRTGMPKVNRDDLSGVKFQLPSIIEQKRIVRILSTWDKAIELKEKLIEEKKKQKLGLTQNLLTKKVRLPEFEGEWKENTIKDHFNRVTRKNTNLCKNVLTISAQQGLINQEEYFNKSVASSILDNYYLLKRGEFAYNKSYSNGYPMGAIKRLNDYEEGIVTTLYICFSIKDREKSNGDFFEHYFESGILDTLLTIIAHEGGRAHGLLNVSPKDFFDLKIIVPSPAEQEAIASVLNMANKEITLHEKELESLKQQKKGLMQFLLTGIVRLNIEEN